MTSGTVAYSADLETQARQSLGSSGDAIYRMVARAIASHGAGGGRIVDVGCGGGGLWRAVHERFASYCGLDAVRYDALPPAVAFHRVDLNAEIWPDVAPGDVVAAVETIEHLENPWAFMRHLAALGNPGAWIIVTTPNQLSLLSLMALAVKQRFVAFPDAQYPAHRTALLECDLARAAGESGLDVVEVGYSWHGRLPLTPWHYPPALARTFPRALSDNVMLVARARGGRA
jgi:2-polyprenyl-3-methyl-5-hydroxy-6-metoxy-1,4-benzoquinol methylase